MKYPLQRLRKREINIEDVIFVAASTLRGEKTVFDRKEELKDAGFIFNPKIKKWGGWITTYEEGKKLIDKIKNMKFEVTLEPEMYSSELSEELEDYEEGGA